MTTPRERLDRLSEILTRRPILVALAGSNGAGKTTFYHSQLADTGLRFVNADDLASCLKLGAYEAAQVADSVRRSLVQQRESFVFETVFSDPAGDKLLFLEQAAASGYQVVLIFIEIPDVATSLERVAIRHAQGGHDVPDHKLRERFVRTRTNLERAIERLPVVVVFDNSDLAHPFRLRAVHVGGESA